MYLEILGNRTKMNELLASPWVWKPSGTHRSGEGGRKRGCGGVHGTEEGGRAEGSSSGLSRSYPQTPRSEVTFHSVTRRLTQVGCRQAGHGTVLVDARVITRWKSASWSLSSSIQEMVTTYRGRYGSWNQTHLMGNALCASAWLCGFRLSA